MDDQEHRPRSHEEQQEAAGAGNSLRPWEEQSEHPQMFVDDDEAPNVRFG